VKGETLLSGAVESPAWLRKNPPFPFSDVLPTSNALVHLPSFIEGKAGAIQPPTPDFFCSYALDYGFDPDATHPDAWMDFLLSVWPNDGESILFLQEWMGYLLTADTRQQKIAVLIGPRRTGKGTIARTITRMIGACNVATPTLAGLSKQFGAACLIGKPVAIIGDARQSKWADWALALETILGVSGEDTITLHRKHKTDWTGRLPTRLMILSNELPRFPDASGAFASRLIVLRFTTSFEGREDRNLEAKLRAEAPGILLWAIDGWKRLRNRGGFIQPPSGDGLLTQIRELCSPVGEFIEDRCNVDQTWTIPRDELFQAWKDWCLSRNRDPGTTESFGRQLYAAVPTLESTRPRDTTGLRYRAYKGIGLKSAF
jgi:putative DNA primase/helicase